MSDCIFCKIIKDEIPSDKIYEDKKVLAFLDIAPVNPGHTLIVSKEHYEDLLETPEDVLETLIVTTKKLSSKIKEAVKADGINIGINVKSAAGQAVPHIHIHIMPRFKNDNLHLFPQKKYKDNEAKEIVKKIKNLL